MNVDNAIRKLDDKYPGGSGKHDGSWVTFTELREILLALEQPDEKQFNNRYQELVLSISNSNKRIGVLEDKIGSNIKLQDVLYRIEALNEAFNKRLKPLEVKEIMCTCPDHKEPHNKPKAKDECPYGNGLHVYDDEKCVKCGINKPSQSVVKEEQRYGDICKVCGFQKALNYCTDKCYEKSVIKNNQVTCTKCGERVSKYICSYVTDRIIEDEETHKFDEILCHKCKVVKDKQREQTLEDKINICLAEECGIVADKSDIDRLIRVIRSHQPKDTIRISREVAESYLFHGKYEHGIKENSDLINELRRALKEGNK